MRLLSPFWKIVYSLVTLWLKKCFLMSNRDLSEMKQRGQFCHKRRVCVPAGDTDSRTAV